MKEFIIGFVVGALLMLLTESRHSDKLKNSTNQSTTVLHDTVWYKAESDVVLTGSTQRPIPAGIDTAQILQSYFASNAFSDSISDHGITAVIKDSVSENRIVARNFTYQINRPLLTQNIQVSTQPKTKTTLLAGVFAAKQAYGPQLICARPKAQYGIGYDLNNKSLALQLSWKLFSTTF